MSYAPDDLLTDKEASPVTRCSVSKLQKDRTADPPSGPRFVRLGNSVRYRYSDLMRWLERSTVTTTDDPDDATPNINTLRRAG